MPKGVVILPSYYEALKVLDEIDRLHVLEAVIEYGLYDCEPQLSPALNGYFLLIKPNIDASQRRHAAAVNNGNLGGRPPKNQSKNQSENQNKNQNRNQLHNQEIEIEKDSDFEMERESGDRGGEGIPKGDGGERTVAYGNPYKPPSEEAMIRKRDEAVSSFEEYLRKQSQQ